MNDTPTTAEPPAEGTPPQTVWECCMLWADLLITLRVAELEQAGGGLLAEDDAVTLAGVDRHLVVVLIAAALHERILRLGLSFPDAVFVPLAAPQEEGVTGTLRRSAYAALELSPAIEDLGGSSRTLLLREAISSHPDDRLLWQRVRNAALDAVDCVAELTPACHTGPRHPDARAEGPYWEQGITIGDVLLRENQRRHLDSLGEAWGVED